MASDAETDRMNLIALPIIHTATRRAVIGAHASDRVLPAPRLRRR
jgi:hypothetical protein